MAVLDFKEIPEAHLATGLQDTFEFFAREFLEFMGFKIISSPDRGADGGVDLIVEQNIIDRLRTHNCDAFLGFYSTIPSSGLTTNLEGFRSNSNVEYFIYDKELIERHLLNSSEGISMARRFFPLSYVE